jgi:hypothetical protein
MKLNPDCTREILLAIEDLCDIKHYFSSIEDLDRIKGNFSKEEILYHARQCHLNGMLYKYSSDFECEFYVFDLSPKGHEFLAHIREDNIWEKVKSISGKVGSTSLSTLSLIAANVISEIVKSQL